MVYVLRETPLPKKEAPKDTDENEAAADEEPEETASDEEKWRDDPRQQWRRWYEERKVVTGIASTTEVEIVEGLEEGEEVALADPSKPQEERS